MFRTPRVWRKVGLPSVTKTTKVARSLSTAISLASCRAYSQFVPPSGEGRLLTALLKVARSVVKSRRFSAVFENEISDMRIRSECSAVFFPSSAVARVCVAVCA